MKELKGVIVAMVLSISPLSLAQPDDSSAYVDFGSLEQAYGEPRVMVNIGGALLKLAAAMSQETPEAELLRSLEAVRVDVYDTGANPAPALARAKEVATKLQGRQWEPIVRVREDDQFVQIFVKSAGEVMTGFAVMAVDDSEAVFINILGAIDPSRLQEVMTRFDVDLDLDLDLDMDREPGGAR